jgi:hypothetical protein
MAEPTGLTDDADDAPASLRLARALALLHVAADDTDPASLADALWLARRLQPPRARRSRAAPSSPAVPSAPPPPARASASPPTLPPPPAAAAAAARVPLFAPQGGGDSAEVLRATRVRVPAADALPQATRIERALRPFMRRHPSRVRHTLDALATAHESAERQQVTPVFRPLPERWFDVALVLDDGDSMSAWRATARELRALLARHGAFGQVHLWQLQVVDGARVVLHGEAGLDAGGRALLTGADGRTLVLLLTHGTGPAWRDGLAARWLRRLVPQAVVALVQMLPRHAWAFTAAGDAGERVRSRARAAPNGRLQLYDVIADAYAPVASGVALPVLPLDADAIAYWAQFVMAPRRLAHGAVWLDADAPTPVADGHPTVPAARPAVPAAAAAEASTQATAAVDARARIARFRARASPPAYALLRRLAVAPVTLPVMRLLQSCAGAPPSSAPLAEVLLSGLLVRVHTGADAEEHVYDFEPAVRDWLLGGMSDAELRRVDDALDPTREQLRAFVETRAGRQVKDFAALVLDPQGAEMLPAQARAFVEVSRRLYERAGVLPDAASAADVAADAGATTPAAADSTTIGRAAADRATADDAPAPSTTATESEANDSATTDGVPAGSTTAGSEAASSEIALGPKTAGPEIKAAVGRAAGRSSVQGVGDTAGPLRVAILRGADLRRPPPLQSALHEALKRAGHEIVPLQADLVILVTEANTSADADEVVAPDANADEIVARLRDAMPAGSLHGWPAPAQRWIVRRDEAQGLDTLLRERVPRHAQLKGSLEQLWAQYAPDDPRAEQARRGIYRTTLTALPMSGARQLLGEVLMQSHWRQRFPGGLWFDQLPLPPAQSLRRGARLVIAVQSLDEAALAPGDVLVNLVYARKHARVDIGYLSREAVLAELAARGLDSELAPLGFELCAGVPYLVGPVAVGLRAGGTPPAEMSPDPDARLAVFVGWMLQTLPEPLRARLITLSTWHAGYERADEEVEALAHDLGWLHRDQRSTWLDQAAARAVAAAAPEAVRAAHERVLARLHFESPGAVSLIDYACRYQLIHASAARGSDGVLAVLRDSAGLAPLLQHDRAGVQQQLATLAGARGAALVKVLRAWRALDGAADLPAPRLAALIAGWCLGAAEPAWQLPSGTGIDAAFKAGVTGAGVTVWVPATGCDATHPLLAGANISGELADPNGHGTAVVSLLVGVRQGVAPGCRVIATRMVQAQGTVDQASVLRAVLQMLDQPADLLPHIACWALGEPLREPRLQPLQRELAAAFAALAERGVLVVAAAGNDGPDRMDFPAVLPTVLAVGACDARGRPASFSSRGEARFDWGVRRIPDLYGFGVDVPVAMPVSAPGSGTGLPGAKRAAGASAAASKAAPIAKQSGTSFAAAYVAGIAALHAQSTGLRGAALRQVLLDTADRNGLACWRPQPPSGGRSMAA